MPRVLLSHNPDVAEENEFLASGYRVDLMLSGHTHGGQVRLPGIGTPVTNSVYGQKYAAGLVDGPVCPVYVSRGLGMTAMPIRFACRPEIAVIELRCASPT
jgi:predicted MPP superfamily phosphohydrolase